MVLSRADLEAQHQKKKTTPRNKVQTPQGKFLKNTLGLFVYDSKLLPINSPLHLQHVLLKFCQMSCEEQDARNKLSVVTTPNYKEIWDSVGLSPIFAQFRSAVSETILDEDILGIETNPFIADIGKMEKYVCRYGKDVHRFADDLEISLKVSPKSSNNSRVTDVIVDGFFNDGKQTGFAKLLIHPERQIEAYWLKGRDGLLHLEQVVVGNEVYNSAKLSLTENKHHARIPNTRISFILTIEDIKRDSFKICC